MRHYKVDPDQFVASGISHGGWATWKYATMWPDLWAAATPHVSVHECGGRVQRNQCSRRNGFVHQSDAGQSTTHPDCDRAGEADTTCGWIGPLRNQAVRDQFVAMEHEFEFWSFVGAGHVFGLPSCAGVSADVPLPPSAKPCGYSFLIDYLDKTFGAGQPVRRKTLNLARVGYTANEGLNEPLFGMVGDHAYWVSNVTVRAPGTSRWEGRHRDPWSRICGQNREPDGQDKRKRLLGGGNDDGPRIQPVEQNYQSGCGSTGPRSG